MDDKEKQNLKYTFLAAILLCLTMILLKVFVLAQAPLPEPTAFIAKQIEIDWSVLRNKILIENPVFQVDLSLGSKEEIEAKQKVSLIAEVEGTLQGKFKYSFDCQNDNVFELETDFLNQTKYQATDLCSYEKGDFEAQVEVTPEESEWSPGSASIVFTVISDNKAPVVEFCDVNPTRGTTQKSSVFSFTLKAADPEGKALSYLWDFGDGATSSEISPFHHYQAEGGYLPKVYVEDDQKNQTICIVSSLLVLDGFDPFVSISAEEGELDPGRQYPFLPTIYQSTAPVQPAATTTPEL